MKRNYEVTKNFWVGDCNIQLKKGETVIYDDISYFLSVDSKEYEARNLKAAIKAEWLTPENGDYPELDGPLGETESEAVDRRRKERFIAKEETGPTARIIKDERSVGVITSDEELAKLINADLVISEKIRTAKKKFIVVEDDTKTVGKAIIIDKDITSLKKAMGQGDKTNKGKTGQFEIFTDHYDSETIQVGKYTDATRENTIKTWSKLHWSKKADVIKKADDKTFLTQLKGVETSDKIQSRIDKRLEAL